MEDFLGSDDSSEKKSLSIALGVFIGMSPIWGFHTITVLFLAIVFKLNKVIAFAFSNVSLPPFIPIILFCSLKYGCWLLGEEFSFSLNEIEPSMAMMKYLKAYIVGSLALSLTSAVISGFAGYIFLSLFEKKKVLKNG